MKNSKRRESAEAILTRIEKYYAELQRLRTEAGYDDLDEGIQIKLDKKIGKQLESKGLFAGGTMEGAEAERTLELCDIYDQMTEEERARIHACPAFQQDLRCLADIREKYGLSWNELRGMLTVEDDEFSDRLGYLCRKSGLSQRAIAEKLNVPLRTLEHWLAGTRVPAVMVQQAALDGAERLGRKERHFSHDERRARLIKADHLTRVKDQLGDVFVVFYGDTNVCWIYDGTGLDDDAREGFVKDIIREAQAGANYSREILAKSGNVYFVY